MEANKILGTELLDLLFEGRNKEYGAYALRRGYNRRLVTALGVTVTVSTLIFLSSLFAEAKKDSTDKFIIDDVAFSKLPNDPIPLEPPPALPPRTTPPPNVEKIKFTLIQIVDDKQVNNNNTPPEVDMLEGITIDVINESGTRSMASAVPDVDDRKGIVVIKTDTDNDPPFTSVEVEADFPGGMASWRKFLERNLSADVATSAAAPSGTYKVIVQFIVDKEGHVSEVTALTNHGYGMEEEAVRVIRKSGKWIPAIQNGRSVKAYRKQPVTFMVTEG